MVRVVRVTRLCVALALLFGIVFAANSVDANEETADYDGPTKGSAQERTYRALTVGVWEPQEDDDVDSLPNTAWPGESFEDAIARITANGEVNLKPMFPEADVFEPIDTVDDVANSGAAKPPPAPSTSRDDQQPSQAPLIPPAALLEALRKATEGLSGGGSGGAPQVIHLNVENLDGTDLFAALQARLNPPAITPSDDASWAPPPVDDDNESVQPLEAHIDPPHPADGTDAQPCVGRSPQRARDDPVTSAELPAAAAAASTSDAALTPQDRIRISVDKAFEVRGHLRQEDLAAQRRVLAKIADTVRSDDATESARSGVIDAFLCAAFCKLPSTDHSVVGAGLTEADALMVIGLAAGRVADSVVKVTPADVAAWFTQGKYARGVCNGAAELGPKLGVAMPSVGTCPSRSNTLLLHSAFLESGIGVRSEGMDRPASVLLLRAAAALARHDRAHVDANDPALALAVRRVASSVLAKSTARLSLMHEFGIDVPARSCAAAFFARAESLEATLDDEGALLPPASPTIEEVMKNVFSAKDTTVLDELWFRGAALGIADGWSDEARSTLDAQAYTSAVSSQGPATRDDLVAIIHRFHHGEVAPRREQRGRAVPLFGGSQPWPKDADATTAKVATTSRLKLGYHELRTSSSGRWRQAQRQFASVLPDATYDALVALGTAELRAFVRGGDPVRKPVDAPDAEQLSAALSMFRLALEFRRDQRHRSLHHSSAAPTTAPQQRLPITSPPSRRAIPTTASEALYGIAMALALGAALPKGDDAGSRWRLVERYLNASAFCGNGAASYAYSVLLRHRHLVPTASVTPAPAAQASSPTAPWWSSADVRRRSDVLFLDPRTRSYASGSLSAESAAAKEISSAWTAEDHSARLEAVAHAHGFVGAARAMAIRGLQRGLAKSVADSPAWWLEATVAHGALYEHIATIRNHRSPPLSHGDIPDMFVKLLRGELDNGEALVGRKVRLPQCTRRLALVTLLQSTVATRRATAEPMYLADRAFEGHAKPRLLSSAVTSAFTQLTFEYPDLATLTDEGRFYADASRPLRSTRGFTSEASDRAGMELEGREVGSPGHTAAKPVAMGFSPIRRHVSPWGRAGHRTLGKSDTLAMATSRWSIVLHLAATASAEIATQCGLAAPWDMTVPLSAKAVSALALELAVAEGDPVTACAGLSSTFTTGPMERFISAILPSLWPEPSSADVSSSLPVDILFSSAVLSMLSSHSRTGSFATAENAASLLRDASVEYFAPLPVTTTAGSTINTNAAADYTTMFSLVGDAMHFLVAPWLRPLKLALRALGVAVYGESLYLGSGDGIISRQLCDINFLRTTSVLIHTSGGSDSLDTYDPRQSRHFEAGHMTPAVHRDDIMALDDTRSSSIGHYLQDFAVPNAYRARGEWFAVRGHSVAAMEAYLHCGAAASGARRDPYCQLEATRLLLDRSVPLDTALRLMFAVSERHGAAMMLQEIPVLGAIKEWSERDAASRVATANAAHVALHHDVSVENQISRAVAAVLRERAHATVRRAVATAIGLQAVNAVLRQQLASAEDRAGVDHEWHSAPRKGAAVLTLAWHLATSDLVDDVDSAQKSGVTGLPCHPRATSSYAGGMMCALEGLRRNLTLPMDTLLRAVSAVKTSDVPLADTPPKSAWLDLAAARQPFVASAWQRQAAASGWRQPAASPPAAKRSASPPAAERRSAGKRRKTPFNPR